MKTWNPSSLSAEHLCGYDALGFVLVLAPNLAWQSVCGVWYAAWWVSSNGWTVWPNAATKLCRSLQGGISSASANLHFIKGQIDIMIKVHQICPLGFALGVYCKLSIPILGIKTCKRLRGAGTTSPEGAGHFVTWFLEPARLAQAWSSHGGTLILAVHDATRALRYVLY